MAKVSSGVLAALLLLLGCARTPGPRPTINAPPIVVPSSEPLVLPPPEPPAIALAADGIEGSIWQLGCEGCEAHIKTNYVELRADGLMGFNNRGPEDFTYDGTDRWRLEGRVLRLVWTDGYSTNTYDLAGQSIGAVIIGKKSNTVEPVTAKRLR